MISVGNALAQRSKYTELEREEDSFTSVLDWSPQVSDVSQHCWSPITKALALLYDDRIQWPTYHKSYQSDKVIALVIRLLANEILSTPTPSII